MEHLVNMAFGFDDIDIVNRIKEFAYDEVVKNLTNEAMKSLPRKSYYGDEVNWNKVVDTAVKQFLDNNSEAIIKSAAAQLCESMKRTKAVKEAMVEAIKGGQA